MGISTKMNIFILDWSPKLSAMAHCDKHVPKMILESAQMICTASNEYGVKSPYKSAYINHPCTIWARQSWENFDWLCTLATTLNDEYKKRFKHNKNHKSYDAMMQIDMVKLFYKMPRGFTPFAQAMPDQYKHENPVVAYRNYYKSEKEYFAKWRLSTPIWWK